MSAPKIAVLDYGIGNLRSAQKGLQRVGADARLTSDETEIAAADAVVLPGVGSFGRCMEELHGSGLGQIAVAAAADGRPFLGICVGMQLLFAGSDESPGVAGLGVFPEHVHLLPDTVKRPQMQWNQIKTRADSALFRGVEDGWFYFVHSYAAEIADTTIATCDYGGPVSAAVERGPVMATQFHPEKSGKDGLALLKNFVALVEGA